MTAEHEVESAIAPPAKRSDFREYPTVITCCGIAIAVTIAWGARLDISPLLETAEIRRGELWRLLTSAFPHLDIVHLFANLYWLWEFGQPIERHFGHVKTALLLMLLAVVSGAFEFGFLSGGVGLSGVGFGLFGLLWILSRRDDRFHKAISRQTSQLFAMWFVFCVAATWTGFMPIGNVAHGTGFITGVLIGLAITSQRRRRLLIGTVSAFALSGLWSATLGRPLINLSGRAGYEEARWGYEDLIAHQDASAVRWLRDASRLQPDDMGVWHNLALAYQRVGDRQAAVAAAERATALGDDTPKPR